MGVIRRNLILNPNFEIDTTSWILDAGFARDTSVAHGGVASVKSTAAADFPSFYQMMAMPVTAGLDYTLSIWYNSVVNSGDPMYLQINIDDAFGANLIETTFPDTGGLWARKVTTINSGVNTALAVRILNHGGSTTTYFDEILFEQASSAGDYFDGDTTDTAQYLYAWEGAPGNSISSQSTNASGSMQAIHGQLFRYRANPRTLNHGEGSAILVDNKGRITATAALPVGSGPPAIKSISGQPGRYSANEITLQDGAACGWQVNANGSIRRT